MILRANLKITIYGFTIIECLIAIGIIAILAAIAYPIYSYNLVTARRTQAEIELTDLTARLEQYYCKSNSYKGAIDNKLAVTSNNNFYHFKITITSKNSYIVQAIPIKAQAKQDNQCGTLTLDQLGNKQITGTGNCQQCWDF